MSLMPYLDSKWLRQLKVRVPRSVSVKVDSYQARPCQERPRKDRLLASVLVEQVSAGTTFLELLKVGVGQHLRVESAPF